MTPSREEDWSWSGGLAGEAPLVIDRPGDKKIPLRCDTGGGKVYNTYAPRGAPLTDTMATTATLIARTEEAADLLEKRDMSELHRGKGTDGRQDSKLQI
jgi:hypothetical protein